MSDYQKQLNVASEFIKEKDDFLIVSHVNPDGDAISSSLAIAQILKLLGKSFVIANQDVVPKKFNYLCMCEDIKRFADIKRKYANVITVDIADFSRCGDIERLLDEKHHILNIDHHFTNDNFGEINLINPEAAAAAEIIYDLVIEMDIKFNKDLATAIYTGILTDTGGFRYSNTTPKVMKIASVLLEYGVPSAYVAEVTLETMTKEYLELLKIGLSNLDYLEDNKIAWTIVELKDMPNSDVHSEGIINYARNVEGVEIGIFYKEVSSNEYKVSLRSKRYVDVGSIAQHFGGGGHKRAAGFTFLGELATIKEELLKIIKMSKGWKEIE